MLAVAHGDLGRTPSNDLANVALWSGAALGVVFIPLYFLGYLAAVRLIADASTSLKQVLTIAGASTAIFATLTHGLTALEVELMLGSGEYIRTPPEIFARATPPLPVAALLTAVSVVVGSVAFSWAARYSRPTHGAGLHWWLNPVVVVLVLAAVALPSKLMMTYLAPSAPNIAHLVFFLACRYAIAAQRARREQY